MWARASYDQHESTLFRILDFDVDLRIFQIYEFMRGLLYEDLCEPGQVMTHMNPHFLGGNQPNVASELSLSG